jgi:hypothetical protein
MVSVASTWLTTYLSCAVEAHPPIINALGAYWSYVACGLAAYHKMAKENQLGAWLNSDDMDDGLRHALVTDRPLLIAHIQARHLTYEVCHAAIRKWPEAVRYTDKVHPELSIIAIRKNPYLIEFTRETPELCLAAVNLNTGVIQKLLCSSCTLEVRLAAVIQNPDTLEVVLRKTCHHPEVSLAAVSRKGLLLKHVPVDQHTEYLCLVAVRQNGLAMKYVRNPTLPILMAAVTQNPLALQYISDPPPRVLLALVLGRLSVVAQDERAAHVAEDVAAITAHVTAVIQQLSE